MKYIKRYLVCFMLVLGILNVNILPVQAGYNGKYNLSAPHEVNKYIGNTSEIAKLKKKIWQEMRSWGMTEAGVAGVMGNIQGESGFDPSRTQGNVPWSSFSYSTTGLGLVQWTYYAWQDKLFDMAHAEGKQWTDLGVQLKYLKEIVSGNEYKKLFTSNDVNACADLFLDVYEKPAVRNYGTRRSYANAIYEEYKGVKGKSTIGTTDSNNGGKSITLDEVLKAAKKRADYVRDKGFRYGNAFKNPAFDDSERRVSCDRYVQWVLYDIGFTDLPKKTGLVVKSADKEYDLPTWCKNHKFKKIKKLSDVKAGDIIFQSMNSSPHVYLLGNKKDGNDWERYDCGADFRIQGTQPFVEPIENGKSFSFAYRFIGVVTLGGEEDTSSKSGGSKDGSFIKEEWDLEGMPEKPSINLEASKIEFASSSDLNTGENLSTYATKNAIKTSKVANYIDKGRVLIVCIGLLLMLYDVLLIVSYLFDSVNSFLDISLVSLLTFGKVTVSDDLETYGKIGFANRGKMFKIFAVISMISLFLISGGVNLYLSKFILWVSGVI